MITITKRKELQSLVEWYEEMLACGSNRRDAITTIWQSCNDEEQPPQAAETK